MTPLALLRHAPTEWNRDGRMQGRVDTSLLSESRADLLRLRIPEAYAGFQVRCSPLKRCLETAAALRLVPTTDPRLVEMDWGDFQGRTLAELRAAFGPALAENESRGLDFRPPRGESPREVQERIEPFLIEVARHGRPTLAITHRGVIRAIYARATGWDMTDEAPDALDPHAIHVFTLDRDGRPCIDKLNVPLEMR